MTATRIKLALAGLIFALVLFSRRAASWFELNFGLSGPRHDSLLRCVAIRRARHDQLEIASKESSSGIRT